MDTQTPQRRTIFIKKSFQLRFMLTALALILFSGLCSAILIYNLTGEDLQAQSISAHTALANASERLIMSILIGNAVSILVAGVISVISILYTSHKLAGPLYRFETLCAQIGDGNLEGVTHLRQTDQLQDLALAFGQMVEKMRQQREQHAILLEQMRLQIDEFDSAQNLTSEQQYRLAELRRIREQLAQSKKA